ncbi:MAG: hypothetical protein GY925_16310 [Actinomycetia bacterium]|nr:hypothetical protein [Actinomycetes bacterium]
MNISYEAVSDQLSRSQRLGFLGDGPVADHVRHASELLEAAGTVGGGTVVDLGSGGGVPGLVALLDERWERIVLLDRSERRCAFLRTCVAGLEVGGHVEVVCAEAEVLGRNPEFRGMADAVVSRSFGPAAATLECASALCRRDGVVVVSDPPQGREWPTEGLQQLGLVEITAGSTTQLSLFVRVGELSSQYPRRAGVPARRPLW